MNGRLRSIGGRFLVMLGGEGLQSAFAFALNISLVRSLSAENYGVFAIVTLIGGFGVTYVRSLMGVPACTYIPRCKRTSAARLYAVLFGSQAVVFCVTGAGLVAVVLALAQAPSALAGGAFVGAWSLRSYSRIALFAQGRTALATFSDVIFAAAAASLCVPLVLYGQADRLLGNVFWALTVAHCVGVATGLAGLRQPVRISLRRSIRRRIGKMLPSMTWSIVSVTTANIQGQGAVLLLAAVSGPAAYAPIAATMAFFSPLRLAAFAMANLTQPDLSGAMARSGPRGVMEILGVSTAMIGVLCGAYGIMLACAFPYLSLHAFAGRFGDAPLNLIAVNIWVMATLSVLYSIPKTFLETRQQFREIAALAAISAFVCLPIVGALLLTTSPAVSLAGIGLSELIILMGSWIGVIRIFRSNKHASRLPGPSRRRRAGRFSRWTSSDRWAFGWNHPSAKKLLFLQTFRAVFQSKKSAAFSENALEIAVAPKAGVDL